MDSAKRNGDGWSPRCLLLAAALAVGVALFRILTDRGFSNDHYMHLAWAKQVLTGDMPGRDFVDPGMPLMYVLSAGAFAIGHGPFAELVLCASMLGLTSAIAFIVTRTLARSSTAGVGAALAAAAMQPRLYNYPKLLVPAGTLLALQWYATRPSRARLAMLAGWVVIGALFRHDLGLYAGIAATIGLATLHAPHWRTVTLTLARFGGLVLFVAAPYLVYVSCTEGLAEHLRVGLEFSKGEAHQLRFAWPQFQSVTSGVSGWLPANAVALLFYYAYLLAAIATVLLVVRRNTTARARGVATAAVALLALYIPIILRYPLDQRIQDLAVVIAVPSAWCLAEIGGGLTRLWAHRSPLHRLGASVGVALVATVFGTAAVSAWMFGAVGHQIAETRVFDGPRKMRAMFAETMTMGSTWPWGRFWPSSGGMPDVVRYIRQCTRPSDRLLVTWNAPELYYFSDRRFAAGHALLLPPVAFTTAEDQALMLTRLSRQAVPVVLRNEATRAEMATAYPRLDAYIERNYTRVGEFTNYDDATITLLVSQTAHTSGTYGTTSWPCGLETAANTSATRD